MFSPYREFIDVYDRQFESLTTLQGRAFVAGARRWLRWLQGEPRTVPVVKQLQVEADECRNRLNVVVQAGLDELQRYREILEKLGKEAADSPQAKPPTANSPGEPEREIHERYTFRFFDRESKELRASHPRFHPFRPSTDPLEQLRKLVQAKINIYTSEHVAIDGSARRRTVEELSERDNDLSEVSMTSFSTWYDDRLNEIGLDLYSSGGRAFHILDEVLNRELHSRFVVASTWFSISVGEGAPIRSGTQHLAGSLFALPTPGTDDAKRHEQILTDWGVLLRECAATLYREIRARIGQRMMLLSAIDRFRLRSELYDVERLRDVCGASIKPSPHTKRQLENNLTQELARYLFDVGFDVLTELSRGESRVDLVHLGELYLEAKKVNLPGGDRACVVDGYRQAMDGVRSYMSAHPAHSVKVAVLAIYVLDGPLYDLPAVLHGGDIRETIVLQIDLRLAKNRGARDPKPRIKISEAEFLATLEEDPEAQEQDDAPS